MEPTVGKERLKKLRGLARRKAREESGLQLLEGPRLVAEALAAGRVSELFVRRDRAEYWSDLAGQVPLHAIDDHDLSKIADVKTAQEIIGVGPLPDFLEPQALLAHHDRVLVLDAVQDPGNVGTLCRSARALGLDAVLFLPGTADPTSPKVLRASAGTLLRLGLAKAEDPGPLIESEHTLVLPVVRGGEDLTTIPRPDRFALVAGNEAAGTTLQSDSALKVTIPMAHGVESLNVAVACAVILGRWLG